MMDPSSLSDLASSSNAVAIAVVIIIITLLFWFLRRRGSSNDEAALLLTQKIQLRSFKKAEVASHNSQKDCWIVVKDKVYDVTSYVEEHPGGLAILKNAGGDATEGFHGPQHPPRVFDIIDDFLIGDLID